MNLHWPKTKHNNYAPWYIISWRLLWYPLILTARWALIAFVCIGFGFDTAAQMKRDTK